MLNKEEIEKIIADIWAGKLHRRKLPENLYRMVKDDLINALESGFGMSLVDVSMESPAYFIKESMSSNLIAFSSSKVFQYVNDSSNVLLDKNGFVRSFSEFKKDALKIYNVYNVNWLKTEYDMTIKQGDSAMKWVEIEEDKEDLPYLQYQTIGDERVRNSHKPFDGIVKPVGDSFWNSHFPPLDWGCRCEVLQLDAIDGKSRLARQKTVNKNGTWYRGKRKLPETKGLFRQNAGKKGVVFKQDGNNKHPYFNVGKEYKEFQQRNFGLPLI